MLWASSGLYSLQLAILWNEKVKTLHNLDKTVHQATLKLKAIDELVRLFEIPIAFHRTQILIFYYQPHTHAKAQALIQINRSLRHQQKALKKLWKATRRVYQATHWPRFPWKFSEDLYGPKQGQRDTSEPHLEIQDRKLASAATLKVQKPQSTIKFEWRRPHADEFYRKSLF